MPATRRSCVLTIVRILAGFLAAYLIVWIISTLIALVPIPTAKPLPVVVVWASAIPAMIVLTVICIIYMLYGNLPSGSRQASEGCLLFIVGGFIGMIISAPIGALINQSTGIEATVRITIVYISTAVGGGLGLYLARSSSSKSDSSIKGIVGEQKESESVTYQAEDSVQPVHVASQTDTLRAATASGGDMVEHFVDDEDQTDGWSQN